MAIIPHVAENSIRAGVVSAYRLGEEAGILVDGDLTSEAAALAAVQLHVDGMHVAEKNIGLKVKAGIKQGANYLATANTGSDVSAVTDLMPSTRGRNLVL